MNLFTRKARTICMCNVIVPFVCTGFLGIKTNNGIITGSTTDEAHEIPLIASDTEPVSQYGEGEENAFAFITESIMAVLDLQEDSCPIEKEDNEFAFIINGVKAVIDQQESAITVKKVDTKKSTKNVTTKKSTSKNTNNNKTTKSSGKTTSVVTKKEVSKAATYPKPSSSNATGEAIVAYAKKFKGLRYRGGTPSLSSGADCSGFTMLIYRQFGISLPRTVSGQKSRGKEVSKNNLQKGDLVFYKPKGCKRCGVSHVAIYIGGGQIIHETRPGRGVAITSLTGLSNIQYVTARRIINSGTAKVTKNESTKKVETTNEIKTDNSKIVPTDSSENVKEDNNVNNSVVENNNTTTTTTTTIQEEKQVVNTDSSNSKVEVVETPKTEEHKETSVVDNTTVKEESN